MPDKSPEHILQDQVRIALSGHGKFFRANVGHGWIGEGGPVKLQGRIFVNPGDVLLKKARPFTTGLPNGFSDLFGAVPVTITPDMVGKTLAIFTAIEIKTPTGRVSAEQKNYLEVMSSTGARAGVARSVDQAILIATGGVL